MQACDQNKEAYTIEVNLDDSEGKWVKLMTLEDRNYVTHDSAFVEAGSFAILTRGVDGIKSMYLTVEDANGSIRMLVENSSYSLSGTLEEPEIKTDSKAQNDLNAYNEKIRPITEKMAELVAELRKGPDPENPQKVTVCARPIMNFMISRGPLILFISRKIPPLLLQYLHLGIFSILWIPKSLRLLLPVWMLPCKKWKSTNTCMANWRE